MKSNYLKIISKKLDCAINFFEANSSSFLTDSSRKFTVKVLVYFILSKGNRSCGKELLDYFRYDSQAITLSALSQQRDKLSFRALKFILMALFKLCMRNMNVRLLFKWQTSRP